MQLHTPKNSAEMVREQISSRGITNKNILKCMEEVPRDKFIPKKFALIAWSDQPLPIGHSQTISQPYIVAFMTEILEINNQSRVLEIGTGCGYQAAVLSKLAQEVYSVEIIRELSERSEKIFTQLGYDNINLKIGNGRDGWSEFAPFSHIIVTAASDEIPKKLLSQLALHGKMIIPVSNSIMSQNLVIITKTKKGITKRKVLPVRFVPLVNKKNKKNLTSD